MSRRLPARRRRSGHAQATRVITGLAIAAAACCVLGVAWFALHGARVTAEKSVPSSPRSAAAAPPARRKVAVGTKPGEAADATVAPTPRTPKPYEWATRYGTVAHGMGAISQTSWTNSVEAFERNYRRGYRVFEVDFILTSDGRIVARHEWSRASFKKLGQKVPAAGVPTLAQFKRTRILGRYTPVAADDLVKLLERYPDAYVMTDVKDADTRLLRNALTQLSRAIGDREQVRKRVIVQIYQESDYAPASKLGYVNFVYTFYHLTTSRSRAISFAHDHGIKVVTIPWYIAGKDLVGQIRRAGLIPAAHTVNEPSWVTDLGKRGVPIVYSDWLPPVTYGKRR